MGDLQCTLVLAFNPQVQGLRAPQQEVGCHGVQGGAIDLPIVIDLVDQFLPAANHPAQGIGMTAQVLGGAVDHQVGTKLQWVLVDGVAKVLSTTTTAPTACPAACQSGNVHHLGGRVGRAFQVEDFAAFGDLGFDLVVVGGVAKLHLDLKTGQEFAEDHVGAAVGVLDGDDPIPGGEQVNRVLWMTPMPVDALVAASASSRSRIFSSKTARSGWCCGCRYGLVSGLGRLPASHPHPDSRRNAVDHGDLGGAIHEGSFFPGPDGAGS